MSRVWADRIAQALLALLAASVLWSSSTRSLWAPATERTIPRKGLRWALIRAQFADRDFSTFGWKSVLLGRAIFGCAFNIRPRKRRP